LTKAELQVIARKHRWAFEDLAYDQKMQELNRLESEGTKALFRYLKGAYGSGRAVLQALREEARNNLKPYRLPACKDDATELKLRAVYCTADFCELALQWKERESLTLFASFASMYSYLVSRMGGQLQVIGAIQDLVIHQRRRRKTLHLKRVHGHQPSPPDTESRGT
jgi:hypothetical protein